MSATPEASTSPTPDLASSPPSAEKPTPVVEETKPEGPANEWASIAPDLVKGGTVLLGASEIHLPGKAEPGVECKMFPVRTRQLLLIGRILTGTTRPLDLNAMIKPFFTARSQDEQYAAALAAFTNLIITVPQSEREFIQLLFSLVNPVDEKLNTPELQAQWVSYLDNPDVEDTFAIFRQTYINEQERFGQLGKALMNMFPNLARGVTTSEQT